MKTVKNDIKKIATELNNEYPEHPCVAVGAIVFKGKNVLLVRRGQAPSEDLWAIPGGKVKLGESLQQAAEREIKEETSVTIRAGEPVYTFDLVARDADDRIRFHYVIVDLVADYVAGDPRPGDDALEACWVSAPDLKKLNVAQKTIELLRQRFNFGAP
jgi:ADP-ribose pyrophosphatase